MRGFYSHTIEKIGSLLYTNAAVMIGVKPWWCGVVRDDSHASAEGVGLSTSTAITVLLFPV